MVGGTALRLPCGQPRVEGRTRSRAEGDSPSEANKMRPHESRSSRHRAGDNPTGCVGVETPKELPSCVFVRLGLVEPELAAVSIDTTPLPTPRRGVRSGGVPDRERLFPGGDPPPRRDSLRFVAGTNS